MLLYKAYETAPSTVIVPLVQLTAVFMLLTSTLVTWIAPLYPALLKSQVWPYAPHTLKSSRDSDHFSRHLSCHLSYLRIVSLTIKTPSGEPSHDVYGNACLCYYSLRRALPSLQGKLQDVYSVWVLEATLRHIYPRYFISSNRIVILAIFYITYSYLWLDALFDFCSGIVITLMFIFIYCIYFYTYSY